MGRFLLLIAVLAAIAVALCFYLGWFQLSSSNATDTSAVTLTVDKAKFHKDQETAQAKVESVGQEVRNKVAPTTRPAQDP